MLRKVVQRGAVSALRARQMSVQAPPKIQTKLTPELLEEYGRRINPAQKVFGPKDKNIEKWQKFFQDPINAQKPIYIRKGFTDLVIFYFIVAAVGGTFVGNMYTVLID